MVDALAYENITFSYATSPKVSYKQEQLHLLLEMIARSKEPYVPNTCKVVKWESLTSPSRHEQ